MAVVSADAPAVAEATRTVAVLVAVADAVAQAAVVLVAASLPPKSPNKKARLAAGFLMGQSH